MAQDRLNLGRGWSEVCVINGESGTLFEVLTAMCRHLSKKMQLKLFGWYILGNIDCLIGQFCGNQTLVMALAAVLDKLLLASVGSDVRLQQ